RVPKRQRIEIRLYSRAVLRRHCHTALALGREAKLLQLLTVKLKHDRIGAVEESHCDRPFEIRAVPWLEIARFFRNFAAPEALIFDVPLKLMRIRRASALTLSIIPTPAGQRTETGPSLMVDEVIRIKTGILGRAARVDKVGEPESCTEFYQHVLEGP